MSAHHAVPEQSPQEDAYRRMWENVDNDWGFDRIAADGDWTINDFDPFYGADDFDGGGEYHPDPFDNFSLAERGGAGGEGDRDTHATRPSTSSAANVNVMGNTSSSSTSASSTTHTNRLLPPLLRSSAAAGPATTEPSHPDPRTRTYQHTTEQRAAPLFPDHSDDWLDPTTTGRRTSYDNIPDEVFDTLAESVSSDSFTSARSPSYHPDRDFGDEQQSMPGYTRRRGGVRGSRTGSGSASGGFVDLTEEPSSPGIFVSGSRKRGLETEDDAEARKRSRPSASQTHAQRTINVEELDLTNENPSAEEELLQQQQAKTIAAQQSFDEPSGPLKVGQRQCIICMENYTNATVTNCGHIYCHECLWQALKAGEKNSERGVGNCPVCRKPVKKGDKRTGKGMQFVAVSFMKRSAFKGKGRRDLGVLG